MSRCPYTNLLDPDLFAKGNHHAVLAEVREKAGALAHIEDPLSGVPYWAVMKRDLGDRICKEPLAFSSEAKTALPKEMPEEDLMLQRLMMVNMDPPAHIKYRRIARNAFTPKAVQSYEENFRQVAKEVIDAVAPRGECEFVYDVAAQLPLIAILELCGIPRDMKDQFFEWTNIMFFTEDEDMSGVDGSAAAKEASMHVYAYAAELAKQHRIKPMSNIVGALLDGAVDDDRLTDDEFQLFFLMLIAAGNESTRSVTAHGMRLLVENPDQLQILLDRPEVIPHAVDEMLRFNPAFVQMRRTVMQDVELEGEQLKAGDKLILNWHAMNHDPELFENPEKFDVLRFEKMPDLHNQHRAFGVGEHYCIGAHLARLELRVMFEELIPRMRNPKFAEPVQYVRDYFVNGIKSMRITFDPEKPSQAA
ncbi:MAG: cytochrome P450 [Gammaproteobacteria bacterium]|nr:MAG: cytochrome P450 [Gammaproteobacteria bacterium]